MFQIRTAQMRAFSSTVQGDFERRALVHLNDTHPDYAQRHGETGLRMLLKECHAQADAAGLGTERGIVTWAELVIRYGDGFHKREPWADYILALDADAAERVDRLREYL